MSVTGYYRGHEMYFDGEAWRFSDTGELTAETYGIRACGHCGRPATDEGHDPCIANLPGVMNACCGHGMREESYIQFENGVTVRGFTIDGGTK